MFFDIHNPEHSIQSLYSVCSTFFNTLDVALQDVLTTDEQRHEETTKALKILRDEKGRFQVWAESTGAHRVGKMSLDYKLQDASSGRQRVIGFLQTLHGMLSRGIILRRYDVLGINED